MLESVTVPGFTIGVGVGCERKRSVEDDQSFGLSPQSRVAIHWERV